MSFLVRWAWLLLTSHHGLVVAMPVAAAAFRPCRRGTLRSAMVLVASGPVIVVPETLPLAFHAAQRQALHDPPLEEEVQDDLGQRAPYGRAHDWPPKKHVHHD